MRAIAILVAAGPGTRLGAGVPKAFVELAGKTLYQYGLRALSLSAAIAETVPVVPAARVEEARSATAGMALPRPLRIVAGGAERADSVRAGLAAAPDAELIVVHDAARPFVPVDVIDRVVATAAGCGAAIAAIPATDTVKIATADGVVETTPERSRTWLAQTPQAFRADLLRAAHAARPIGAATDDAMLVELLGVPVRLVTGDANNRKITTADDLGWAEWFLRRVESRR